MLVSHLAHVSSHIFKPGTNLRPLRSNAHFVEMFNKERNLYLRGSGVEIHLFNVKLSSYEKV